MPTPRVLLCACAVLVALTACGATTTPEPQSPTTPASTEHTTVTEQSRSEHGSYAQCLAEHGVEQPPAPAPGPAPAPAGVDPTLWEQAMAACAEFAPGPG